MMSLIKNIFLIDDDLIYTYLSKRIIATTGIKTSVSEFSDGLQAIDFLKDNMNQTEMLPDIIFLDLNMPVMGGWDFLQEYASVKSGIKKEILLYIVSSSISPYDLERAKKIDEVTDFISKPLSKDKVFEIIERYAWCGF
jgi:CheY-like chemotaxis protein